MHTLKKLAQRFLKRKPLTIILLLVAALLFCVFVFRQAGAWLFVSDPCPSRLDAICTFAGENVRVEYSKELMARFPLAHWFLSDYKNGHSRILQKQQFDMSRLTSVDTCKSTISEINTFAARIRQVRAEHDRTGDTATLRIGLVSSPYHMRRIKIMSGRRIRMDRIQVYCLPVPFDYYSWNHDSLRYWWRSNAFVHVTTSELFKLAYFILTGYF